jgi:microcin C transport system substrate-binding protein
MEICIPIREREILLPLIYLQGFSKLRRNNRPRMIGNREAGWMKHIQSKLFVALSIFLCFVLTVNAQTSMKEPKDSRQAHRGGQLTLPTPSFPKSFNSLITNTTDSSTVFGLVYDTLMELDSNTLQFKPLIAKSCDISQDKKVFTIKIDPRAKWADGKQITTDDVKFTYDTIMNPKNLTSVARLYYSRFKEPEIIDKYIIKFTANTVHFKNMELLAGLNIIPKHLFAGKDFNKAFNMSLPAGSGPYTLSEVKEGRYYVLTRRKNYWADQLPYHRDMYNFDKIKFKVMDVNVAFEAFKKGEFDVYLDITAQRWVKESNSDRFQKNWIVKQKVYNYKPRGSYGLALNMRKYPFSDAKIRQALCYLLDRKTLIEKIMYNEYKPLTSYWPSLYGYNEEANSLIEYNPTRAKELLKEAGYTRLDKEGYLINNQGRRLEFTILYYSDTFEKHLTLFEDACKQVGIKVNLELLSWATLIKRQEEFNFDAVTAAWTGELFDDAEQLWSSKHADEIGSSNLSGYKNSEVDALIDSLPPIFEPDKRTQILKKIDRIIYNDYPYVLFWDANYTKLFYKNIFGMPKTVFSKYAGNYSELEIISSWWIDPAKVKHYQEAVAKNKSLPKEPEEIFYDKIAATK